MKLLRKREEYQKELERCGDFAKSRVFEQIACSKQAINMADLTFYLEKNGFYPRRIDIEALLRRLDHDASRSINYIEFCELTTLVERQSTV